MKKILPLVLLAAMAASCTATTQLYDWKGYDDAVYAYTKTADEQSIGNLMKVYQGLMKNSGGSRQVPPPGVCADYGYILLKSGKVAEGKELLIRETELYPESKPFIDRILKRFEE